MPRSARILLNKACYHIIARGNQSQPIFLSQTDYALYLHLLKRYKSKYPFNLYAFCLMKNHVHLALEPTDSSELSKAMQGINLSYAIYFNYKYQKNGHLWQGRFKSMVVAKDEYLNTCLNYIEANPLRAGMVKKLEEYRWSSYRYRVLGYPLRVLDSLVS
ncbi:transposase [Candidatus Omnitrophota bacterium]